MNTEQELVFPLNKSKIILRMVLQVAFFIGFSFLFKNSVAHPKGDLFLMILSPAMMVFWASIFFVYLTALLGKEPGLIINPNEIINNTTGVSAEKISWNNIAKTYVTYVGKYGSVRFLTIEVYDFEQYLGQGNILSRTFKWVHHAFFRSSIHLSADTIDISFEEMVETIKRYHKKYGYSKSVLE
ncbi:MAG: hypothetical protein GY755_21670 [Chloroflexi bacterium]|nr:hypothetical protein [Chloroflexota bacterium]